MGMMLPYSPLHHLLMREAGIPLVATSGNRSDEPIATDNDEARSRLDGIADAFLMHDRPIARPCDDSVVRLARGREMVLRRARGYAPMPVRVGRALDPVLAVGAHLRHAKRSDALARAERVGQRVGLGPELDKPASSLTVAGRKRLELARALATEPKLLLLDEVLAGLNPSEIRDIIPVIRAIRDEGVTILMIEHVMQAVMNLCEQVYVLAQGRIIAEGPPAVVCNDAKVIEAYLGAGTAERLKQEKIHA